MASSDRAVPAISTCHAHSSSTSPASSKLLILPVAAVPLSGKTTLARALHSLFGIAHVENDADPQHGRFGAAKRFQRRVLEALERERVVFADKNNHLRLHRERLIREVRKGYQLAGGEGKRKWSVFVLALEWKWRREQEQEVRERCRKRLLQRGENHQTLTPLRVPEWDRVIDIFMKEREPLDHMQPGDAGIDHVLHLDALQETGVLLETVVEFLVGVMRLWARPDPQAVKKALEEARGVVLGDEKEEAGATADGVGSGGVGAVERSAVYGRSRPPCESPGQGEVSDEGRTRKVAKVALRPPGLLHGRVGGGTTRLPCYYGVRVDEDILRLLEQVAAVLAPSQASSRLPSSGPGGIPSDLPSCLRGLQARRRIEKGRGRHHVTLVFMGNPARLARQPLAVRERIQALAILYRTRLNARVKIAMRRIVWNDRMMVIPVRLPDDVPCANEWPHITVGTVGPHVKPVEANGLLSRVMGGAQGDQGKVGRCGFREYVFAEDVVLDGTVMGFGG